MQEFIYMLNPTRPAMLVDGPNPVEAEIMNGDPVVRGGVMSARICSCKVKEMRGR